MPPDDSLVVPLQTTTASRQHAFDLLYREHYRDVYRYALGLTRSSTDAEEVVAEAFVRALRAWDEVPNRPLPWLLLTTRRIATDRWRRARRLAGIAAHQLVERQADAGEGQTEFLVWFEAVSRVLTARQREVLLLRYHADLTDADIARIVDITESGVRSLIQRALAALRSHPELL